MAADAYMEISTGSVWGETADEMFGEQEGRSMGAFEIADFSFSVDSNRQKEGDEPGGAGAPPAQAPPRPANTGQGATPQLKEPRCNNFTIRKPIDKASPDLFLACCDQTPVTWGVVSFREAG